MLIGLLFSLILGGFAAKKIMTIFDVRITPVSTFTKHTEYLAELDDKIISCNRKYELLRHENKAGKKERTNRSRRRRRGY